MKFQTPFDRCKQSFSTIGASKTKQSARESCDINLMLKKYQKNGYLPINQSPELYGDYTNVGSYQDALNIVIKAERQFEGLSSNIRDRFDNDPSKLLKFLSDNKNYDEAAKLGLVTKREVPMPKPVDENAPNNNKMAQNTQDKQVP